MLLTVDIGNTNIVVGIYEGDELLHHWRVGTQRTKTADEYGVFLHNLITINKIDVKELSGGIVCSVVPPLTAPLVGMLEKFFHFKPLVVGPGLKTGMPILYKNPLEVGADRIANSVAAYDMFKQSAIVVDFGTATTFDCISEKGEYLGGAISPGITISSEALFASASKLPKVEIARPKSVIGKTSVESIQSGILYGYASLVDGMVVRIKRELGGKPKVIATGGLAPIISAESREIEEVDEFLTLKGLKLIYEWNSN